MLTQAEIAGRIPHEGRMCLLEQVVEWDENRIHCRATSHRDADNPLRAHGRLGVACGIEYAAQAMAVHSVLLAQAHGGLHSKPRIGYLAGVRSVNLHAGRLDDVDHDLTICAERVLGDAGGVIYQFVITAGDRRLLDGRATVILAAAAAIPTPRSA
ncbi:MAG: hotdog family protein [Ramlibacter sp.]